MKAFTMFVALAVCVSTWSQEPRPSDEDIRETQFESLLEGVRGMLEAIEAAEPVTPERKSAKPPLTLTIHDAVDLTLKRNPKIFIATDEVEILEAQIGQARSGLFPHFSASVGFNYTEDRVPGVSEGFFTNLVAPGSFDVATIVRTERYGVQQTIYTGGSLRAAIDTSKYLAKSEEWRREATKDALEFQTKQAYYDCLTTGALILVAEDSVTTFERHLADTELMFEVGETSRSEVIRARTELGSRRTDVVVARNRELIAYTILRRLINASQDTPLTLTDTVSWTPLEDASPALAAKAIEWRPESRALSLAIQAGKSEHRRVVGQYIPRVGFQGDFTNIDGAGSFSIEGWSFTLGIEWDIFSGNKRKHDKAEARARLNGIEHQLEDITALIETEVQQAYIQVQDAIARIKSEQGNVRLAEEGQRLARLRFKEGIAIQADVLDAELALTNAQTQLVLALREYGVAHAALDKATGRSWMPRDIR